MGTNFATFVRNARVELGLTLREFCRRVGTDPSNWSKVERGVNPPPQSMETLDQIASALHFDKDQDNYNTLIELAAVEFIPDELIDQKVKDQLPIFFRTVRGAQPSEEELNELVKSIKSAWTQDESEVKG